MRVDDRALVGARLATEGALVGGCQLHRRLSADHVARGPADHIFAPQPGEAQERFIDEYVTQFAIQIDHRLRQVIGEQLQLLLSRDSFLLEPLQMVDIGVGRKQSANATLRTAVRVIVDPDPDRRVVGPRKLTFESRRFAMERRFELRPVELVNLGTQDLGNVATLDLVRRLAQPIQECLVRKTVMLLTINIRERQTQRIELALRQCAQGITLETRADCLLQREQIKRGRRLGRLCPGGRFEWHRALSSRSAITCKRAHPDARGIGNRNRTARGAVTTLGTSSKDRAHNGTLARCSITQLLNNSRGAVGTPGSDRNPDYAPRNARDDRGLAQRGTLRVTQ